MSTKMFNNRWLKTIGIVLLLGLIITLTIISVQGQGLQPVSEEDAQAIETTIRRSYELEAQATYTLDGSVLAEVYINDPRGGAIDEKTLELIQYVRQDKSLSSSDVGYLDARQAYFSWLKQGIEKREAIFATIAAEGREQMTPEEEASLVDETGRIAIFNRRSDAIELPPIQINVESIRIEGDVAYAVVAHNMGKFEAILVKVNDHWYMAGGRSLEFNP
jgi:hypothetical protein